MKKIDFVLLAASVVLVSGSAISQVAQGPFAGSIPSGVSVSTNSFGADMPDPEPGVEMQYHRIVPPSPPPSNMPAPTGPEGSNYFENPSEFDGPPPIVVRSFDGLGQAQAAGIPPDPHMAVGPNHIIQTVNISFRISDKAGNTLKTINANSWFQSVLPNSGPFDPKVFYDHYANRWIMVWLNQNPGNQTAYFLLSVSDDDDPIGTWYNWAVPAHLNGSTNSGTWADYQGVGFDNQAIYFTANQWTFAGAFQYAKIRIIGKAQLYANTGGPVAWNDFSNVVHPAGGDAINIRPCIIHGNPGQYYLMAVPNVSFGTFVSLYRITNPLTAPTVTGVTVPVTGWTPAPNAGQLGGGTPLEGGGGNGGLRSEPTYMDSSIWLTHSVNNGGYSSVRYLRVSTVTNSAIEDIAFGEFGFWHIYPTIQPDKDKNLVITFTRTGDTEYAGAAFTWRLNSDLPGLRPTTVFAPGQGNYVRVASGRNRWGDYMGIALDPSDRNNIWMLTEYAAATNTFGDWVHGVRLVPYSGSRASLDKTSIDYGLIEVGNTSDTVSVTLYNIGSNPLTVLSLTRSQSQYSLLNVPSLPVNIGSFDSVRFSVAFTPNSHALITDSITIVSNDMTTPTIKLPLRAKGIIIGRAQVATMYSTSSLSAPPSQLYTINSSTGVPTAVGATGVSEIHTLTIRPTTQELYGTLAAGTSTTVYRMSSGFGDAFAVRTFPIGNMRAIAFNQGDSLYGATTGGRLYRLNLVTGDTIPIGTTPSVFYSGLAFNPITKKLYASTRAPITGRDNIYTVNTATGVATLLGAAGFSTRIIPGITFNAVGTLYGITGSGTQVNELITIDTATAAGALIASTGITGLHSLALRTDSLTTSVGETLNGIPESYVLEQNYPNPFNPTTQIRYGLPRESRASITIYNVIGQEVARLFEGEQQAGYHAVTWDGLNTNGIQVSSGIYFYKLEADAGNGKAVISTKKMILVR